MDVAQLDNLISAVLRDEMISWPLPSDADLHAAFVRRCEYHGVAALVNERRRRHVGWPQTVLEAVHRMALAQAIQELRHQQVLTQLLAALAKVEIAPVLFKGTALAYDLYRNPVWRERADTDMIIGEGDVARCREVLLSQGFTLDAAIPGELVSYEENWRLPGPKGDGRSIDLHRRINNSQILSRLFTYEELYSQARPLPTLCQGALAASRVHALLLACMHRATHKHNPYYSYGIAHYGGNRLIWLYDIHLLATNLQPVEWDEFLEAAQKKGLGEVCLEGLDLAVSRFQTDFPKRVPIGLSKCRTNERVAVYLRSNPVHQQWLEFRTLEGFGKKLRFARKTILPPVSYMRRKYHEARFSWLPWLYVRRAFAGIGKHLRTMRPD